MFNAELPNSFKTNLLMESHVALYKLAILYFLLLQSLVAYNSDGFFPVYCFIALLR